MRFAPTWLLRRILYRRAKHARADLIESIHIRVALIRIEAVADFVLPCLLGLESYRQAAAAYSFVTKWPHLREQKRG